MMIYQYGTSYELKRLHFPKMLQFPLFKNPTPPARILPMKLSYHLAMTLIETVTSGDIPDPPVNPKT